MWSFPLIVITVFLMQTVSKPDMPHINIELQKVDRPGADPDLGPQYNLVFQ